MIYLPESGLFANFEQAIAKQIGIITGLTPDELLNQPDCDLTKEEAKRQAVAIVVAGTELEGFSKDDWDIVTSKPEIVFARTSPEQKLLIVSHFQERGEIVAVTGDGVNGNYSFSITIYSYNFCCRFACIKKSRCWSGHGNHRKRSCQRSS